MPNYDCEKCGTSSRNNALCDDCWDDETRAEKHETNYGEDQAREEHEQEMADLDRGDRR